MVMYAKGTRATNRPSHHNRMHGTHMPSAGWMTGVQMALKPSRTERSSKTDLETTPAMNHPRKASTTKKSATSTFWNAEAAFCPRPASPEASPSPTASLPSACSTALNRAMSCFSRSASSSSRDRAGAGAGAAAESVAWEGSISFEGLFCEANSSAARTLVDYCVIEEQEIPVRADCGDPDTRCFCGDIRDTPTGGSR